MRMVCWLFASSMRWIISRASCSSTTSRSSSASSSGAAWKKNESSVPRAATVMLRRTAWRRPALPDRPYRTLNTAQRSLRLGFAGTPQFSVAALDALLRSRHRVVAVFTQPDRPAGRGQTLHLSAVKRRAIDLGLEVLQPASFKSPDAAAALDRLELDALVVVAYGLILPAAVLALPNLGCFNIHASLLPRWRGAAPIQRALLAGDATTGVTIMRMEAGLDTGPVLAAREVRIAERETAGSLHDRLPAPRGGRPVGNVGA